MDTSRKTLLLGQSEIQRTMTLGDYIDAIERAFASMGAGEMTVPDVVHIPATDGAFHVKSAAFRGEPAYVAVKVNANFPANRSKSGLPTIQGAIVLCDSQNGALLAVIDSIEVTAMRTAAATAVAARYLAPADASTVTIIGCGLQGRVQLMALNEVLPISKAYVFDTDPARRDAYVDQAVADTGLDIIAVDDFSVATAGSDVIVTCTSSRKAFLEPGHVKPGTFIAAVGADNHDKQELSTSLLAAARVVTDVTEQCAEIGELHHALEDGTMRREDVAGELADFVAGRVAAAFGRDDIVVFDSTGSAIQDVAAAGIIYERARAGNIGFAMQFA